MFIFDRAIKLYGFSRSICLLYRVELHNDLFQFHKPIFIAHVLFFGLSLRQNSLGVVHVLHKFRIWDAPQP